MTALDRVRAVLDERNIPHALIGAAALLTVRKRGGA